MRPRNKIIIAISIIIIIAVSIITYNFNKKTNNLSQQINITTNDSLKPKAQNLEIQKDINKSTETPKVEQLPFEELTIPYLQSRQYKSSIKNLKQLSRNSIYTKYIASYDSDGLNINGLLTIPVNAETSGNKYPAIVFVHGYIPPSLYKTEEKYDAYIDNLARNGFVVFKIDLRGHDESDGEAGGGYYSSDYVIDTLNAYAALQNYVHVDPLKIGLWGHSMAGNVVTRSIAAKKDIPAAVIWGGAGFTYQDLIDYGIDDNSYRPPTNNTERQRKRDALFNTHGRFSPNSQFWAKVVPTNYLSDVKTAIQLNHAVNDDVVSIEYSRNFNLILNQTNLIHELKEYPSGGHNINGSSFASAINNTIRFYKENL